MYNCVYVCTVYMYVCIHTKSIYVSIYVCSSIYMHTQVHTHTHRGTSSLCRRHTTHAGLVSVLWFCLSSRPPFPQVPGAKEVGLRSALSFVLSLWVNGLRLTSLLKEEMKAKGSAFSLCICTHSLLCHQLGLTTLLFPSTTTRHNHPIESACAFRSLIP